MAAPSRPPANKQSKQPDPWSNRHLDSASKLSADFSGRESGLPLHDQLSFTSTGSLLSPTFRDLQVDSDLGEVLTENSQEEILLLRSAVFNLSEFVNRTRASKSDSRVSSPMGPTSALSPDEQANSLLHRFGLILEAAKGSGQANTENQFAGDAVLSITRRFEIPADLDITEEELRRGLIALRPTDNEEYREIVLDQAVHHFYRVFKLRLSVVMYNVLLIAKSREREKSGADLDGNDLMIMMQVLEAFKKKYTTFSHVFHSYYHELTYRMYSTNEYDLQKLANFFVAVGNPERVLHKVSATIALSRKDELVAGPSAASTGVTQEILDQIKIRAEHEAELILNAILRDKLSVTSANDSTAWALECVEGFAS